MKYLPITLLLLAGGVLAAIALSSEPADYVAPSLENPPAPIPTQLTGVVPAGHAVVKLEVDGMCCRGCPSTLYDALLALEGIDEAAVEFVASGVPGHIAVVAPEDFPVDRLTGAIASEKYTVRQMP